MKGYLEILTEGQSLTYEQMKAASLQLFSEEVTDSEIAAFLIALKRAVV